MKDIDTTAYVEEMRAHLIELSRLYGQSVLSRLVSEDNNGGGPADPEFIEVEDMQLNLMRRQIKLVRALEKN